MKPLGILCAGLIFLSTMLTAQNTVKTDSINQVNDTLNLQSDHNHLKSQKQAEIKQPELLSPGFRKPQSNYPFAYIPHRNSRYLNNPNYRMPIAKPYFESKMPVMKPDSTIHFHLQIKKIAPMYER